MAGYFSGFTQEILRDYLFFIFSMFLFCIVLGLYIAIKSYLVTKKIESQIKMLNALEEGKVVRQKGIVGDFLSGGGQA